MMHMMQRSLKQIMTLSMMIYSAEGIATSELLDTMEMRDAETDIMSHVHQPPRNPDERDAPMADPTRPAHMTLEELIDSCLFGCLTTDTQAQPAGIEVAFDDETGHMSEVVLNMSKIFKNMKLWNITNEANPIGMLYISGSTAETDFHKMLPLDDFYDAVGLAVIPGYKMLKGNRPSPRLSSLWELVQFLSLALDNVWSQKLHTDDHLALWDNIFRILVEVGSEGLEHVELPHDHQSTCSCYRLTPHILKVCEWIKTHPKEEANMANNPVQALRTILDNVGYADVCSTGHLCPLLFGLLPVLGITSVHIEKDPVVYDDALDSVVRAKIERLSAEGVFAGTIKQLLDTLTQTDDDRRCSWKHLKVPGWVVSTSVFVEIVTKLKQLESIEDATVDVYFWPGTGNPFDVFNNPRARRLLSKCIVSWRSHWFDLSLDEELLEAIKDARIEHLLFSHKVQAGLHLLVTHPEIWQNLKTVRWSGESGFLTLVDVMTLVRIIPSLEKIECPRLQVKCDSALTYDFSREIPRNILSVSDVTIKGFECTIYSMPLLELLWKTLTDNVYGLWIDGRAIESLPAPKPTPAFANKFKALDIVDFDRLSTDMCSHLGAIGGGVEILILTQEQGSNTPANERNEKLVALLGTAGEVTPLGRSVTSVRLEYEISELFDLEPLLHCDKLITIDLKLSTTASKQVNDEEISKVAAAITKLGEKEKVPKVGLSLKDLSADELAKLLRQICPGSDPSRVVGCLGMTNIKDSEFTSEVRRELARYKRATRMVIRRPVSL